MVGNQINLDVVYSKGSSQLPHEDISIICRVSGNQCQTLFIKWTNPLFYIFHFQAYIYVDFTHKYKTGQPLIQSLMYKEASII